MIYIIKFVDLLAVCFGVLAYPLLRLTGRYHGKLSMFQKLSDVLGFQIRSSHYYEPTYRECDLPEDTRGERTLPGLDLNEAGQLALLEQCKFSSELSSIPMEKPSETEYGYHNSFFACGDSEMLYNMIRLKKPKRIFEVGSGQSTLIARLAINANKDENSTYECKHICVEPYEAPWLSKVGVQVVRKRVEQLDLDFFSELSTDDILFIDSSHVIRPYGDVLFEFQLSVPSLARGVIVHVHDIFTPRDYPDHWLRRERKLWNEQYLLESFLTFNSEFEVMCANNWLMYNHCELFSTACPMVKHYPDAEPSSFWFRRKR